MRRPTPKSTGKAKKKAPGKTAAPKVAVKAKPAAGRSPIDRAMIRDLAAMLDETGLTEIEWRRGETSVRVARGGNISMVAQHHQVPSGASAPVADSAHAIPAEPDPASHPGAVKSPMVGTAYNSPSPGAAPFVGVGDMVKAGQTLLIVEAMKTMNPIPAPTAGKVVRILVDNQQPVEFGQVLMLIE